MCKENREKIVDFHEYCGSCKHCDESEQAEPCCDCLDEPVNIDSHKPVFWEKK